MTATPDTITRTDTKNPLTSGPGHCAIVGLQWGDEGKGQIVDLLTSDYDVVTRFNGGNNAGHSVHIGDEKFALHLLPSGITYSDKTNVIGNGVVVDPSPDTGILKEIDRITERGVTIGNNLRISDRAHAVLPYHKVEDALYEAAASKAMGNDSDTIGTTGRGIGPCYADKAYRSTAIRMGDLVDADKLRAKLSKTVPIKNVTLAALAAHVGREFETLTVDGLFDQVSAWGKRLAPHVCDTRRLLFDAQAANKRILFEGANAALLDVDHGTYPFVTSSSTSALGIGTGTGLPPKQLGQIIGVCKSYTSRVGGGPHPTELLNETGEHIRSVGKEFGTTTGRPRRVGWLDLTAVRYTAQLNGCTALVTTGISVLSGIETLKVCVGYTYRGTRLDDFPADADILAEAEPIYQELEGFSETLGELRDYDALPAAAKRYVETIEQFVGVPVRIVCVGPKRSQTIMR